MVFYILLLSYGPIFLQSRRRTIVPLSSTEAADYQSHALTHASLTPPWLRIVDGVALFVFFIFLFFSFFS